MPLWAFWYWMPLIQTCSKELDGEGALGGPTTSAVSITSLVAGKLLC